MRDPIMYYDTLIYISFKHLVKSILEKMSDDSI
jgi:hypothetical protein